MIGVLSGAPYQISGPTGAMSAVLIVIAHQYGPRGLWIAGLMAGIMILAVGIFSLGQIINFIPAPVITGFTSGIALTIAIGQIEIFSESGPPRIAHRTSCRLFQPTRCRAVTGARSRCDCRRRHDALLPRIFTSARGSRLRWSASASRPRSAGGSGSNVHTIGALPQAILLDDRLTRSTSDWHLASDLLMPAITIAMLGSIESLLCGVVAGRMTKQEPARSTRS